MVKSLRVGPKKSKKLFLTHLEHFQKRVFWRLKMHFVGIEPTPWGMGSNPRKCIFSLQNTLFWKCSKWVRNSFFDFLGPTRRLLTIFYEFSPPDHFLGEVMDGENGPFSWGVLVTGARVDFHYPWNYPKSSPRVKTHKKWLKVSE